MIELVHPPHTQDFGSEEGVIQIFWTQFWNSGDFTQKELYQSIFGIFVLKQFPIYHIAFVNYKTSHDFPSVRGWVDNDWILIFVKTVPLYSIYTLSGCSLGCMSVLSEITVGVGLW